MHAVVSLANIYMATLPTPTLMSWCDPSSPLLTIPQGVRFCANIEKDCARPWAVLRRRMLAATGPAIVANAQPTTCGFGTDLMERTGLVAIAVGMMRPMIFYNNLSEPMRLVTAPHDDIVAAGLQAEVAEAAKPFRDEASCKDALSRAITAAGAPPLVDHYCDHVNHGRFAGHFVIHPRWVAQNKYWDISTNHGKPGTHTVERLFATAPLHFVSHNGLGAFGSLVAAKSIPPSLVKGASLSNGPQCIIARYLHRVSVDAMTRAVGLFTRLKATGKVVAVHVRRGDSAMHRECPACVAPDEPDVKSGDRIEMQAIERQLRHLNGTLSPGDGVVVMSDTRGGLRAVRQLVTAVPISWQRQTGAGGRGRSGAAATSSDRHAGAAAVHSTQITSVAAANKLLADFVAMSIADDLVRFGDSSLSGCAQSLAGRYPGREH